MIADARQSAKCYNSTLVPSTAERPSSFLTSSHNRVASHLDKAAQSQCREGELLALALLVGYDLYHPQKGAPLVSLVNLIVRPKP